MTKTERVIKLLLEKARPEILKEFREDSCIASTAAGVDVLTYFNILAKALPVRTTVFNGAFAARIDAGQPWPKADEIKRWTVEDGSYSVGIGYGTQQPGKWAGHLAILAENIYLIDLSIDQASRPRYNIELKPLCVEVDDNFISGRSPCVFNCGDCIIKIEHQAGNDGYQFSPDWSFASRRKKIVQNVQKLIEESL